MKKFRFRLERVLDYRTIVKKEKERELAVKNHELVEAEELLEQIVEEHNSCQVAEGAQTMAELALGAHYQERLQEMLIQQRVLVLEATDAVEQAREAYLEKALEAEVLDKFKGRKREEFKEERKRHERRELDNSVIVRHRRDKE
jgi:flagellar FliJ protein